MNNETKLRLQSLANEFKATMNHAQEVYSEYMSVAIEQALIEAFNELTAEEQTILILGMLTENATPLNALIVEVEDSNNKKSDDLSDVEDLFEIFGIPSPRNQEKKLSDEQKELAGIIKLLKALQEE